MHFFVLFFFKTNSLFFPRFTDTPDPAFFVHVTGALQTAKRALKERKGAANVAARAGTVEDDDFSMAALRDRDRRRTEHLEARHETDYWIWVLRFLKEMCEGHYFDLQEYLRVQHDNSKTYNVVEQVALFGVFVEKYVEIYIPTDIETNLSLGKYDVRYGDLMLQIYRTLTE
jgi:hypothetical protein